MLMDLVETLVTAGEDAGEKEKAYKALEKIGIDRQTADEMAAEFLA